MPREKAKNTMTQEITELLHQDHQKVRELFFQFSAAEEESEKENLVKQILTELYVHSTIEEEIVYPAVKEEAEEGEELVDEAETEHRVVKFLMAELSEMSADEEQFDAKVTVLCELVNHHIREEEKEMFKKLRESGADLNELSEKVVERKEELQSEPLPQMECTLSIREESEEDEEDEEEDDDDDKQQNARRSRSMTSKSPNGAKTANSNRGRRKSA